jgi:uncharacterized membrane protein
MIGKRLSQLQAFVKQPLVASLVISNLLSVLLFIVRASSAHNFRYIFLLWNLVLGYVPLLLAYWLRRRLRTSPWLSKENIALSIVWLGFLPNSFYLASDLIHLTTTGEISKLFDATLFLSCIFNGFVAGFLSVYILHTLLIKRLKQEAHLVIGVVFLLCGFAVYLGRYMRWNSWDVIFNPAGILFDVSDRVINPIAHPESFLTTITFFLLLSTMYGVVWQLVRAIRKRPLL